MNVWPATVSVPLRAAPPLFAAAVNATFPLPLPDFAFVSVIQASFAVAVHAQPAPAVTATLPLPPAASTAWLFGAIEYVHCGGGGGGGGGGGTGAACETVNVWPATVSVPLRAAPLFAATVNATVPLPLPDPPLAIDIHGAFADAVHEQPAAAVTATEPPPAFASTD